MSRLLPRVGRPEILDHREVRAVGVDERDPALAVAVVRRRGVGDAREDDPLAVGRPRGVSRPHAALRVARHRPDVGAVGAHRVEVRRPGAAGLERVDPVGREDDPLAVGAPVGVRREHRHGGDPSCSAPPADGTIASPVPVVRSRSALSCSSSKTSEVPSGDQRGFQPCSRRPAVQTVVISPVTRSAITSSIGSGSGWKQPNASRVPSGDQAGKRASAGQRVVVSSACFAPEPSAADVQIRPTPSSPTTTKASVFPSGDQSGSTTRPGTSVRIACASLPSDRVRQRPAPGAVLRAGRAPLVDDPRLGVARAAAGDERDESGGGHAERCARPACAHPHEPGLSRGCVALPGRTTRFEPSASTNAAWRGLSNSGLWPTSVKRIRFPSGVQVG